MAPTYARITYRTIDGPKTVVLQIAKETDKVLIGYQVNIYGDEKDVRSLHVMSINDITKRTALMMDKKYAQLVKK